VKVVWRFNLAPDIDKVSFFLWLRENVWASSARFGCVTRAYRLQNSERAYCTEAEWPDADVRDRWQRSAEFSAIEPFPGTATLWGAQTGLEGVTAIEIAV
jgi:hypothetical protein